MGARAGEQAGGWVGFLVVAAQQLLVRSRASLPPQVVDNGV